MTALVLHLNGPPGVGKSTLARRWADEHPGTLLLDVDALRTWVSGWQEDFASTGRPVREVALAMITAYAAQGRDVVLPQLVANHPELDRFETASTAGGARFVEVLLSASDSELAQRFADRPRDRPWLDAVHEMVAAAPSDHLAAYAARLVRLVDARPGVMVLPTVTGAVDAAYDELCALVATRR